MWTADHLGGMPEEAGCAERFDHFVRTHPELPGIELLKASVDLAVKRFGFDREALLHELADSSIGDNYPVPDRILRHTEEIVRGYVADEMFDHRPPEGQTLSLFATEGGTAAMCYIFDSLVKNGILRKGDRIALMVPVFTPYLEIPELDTYDFDVVHVEASLFTETGVRQWRYPEEEIAKLADPSIKLVCCVNPSNPPSLALSSRVSEQIVSIVNGHNPDLIIVTDDVYGTFVEGFRSLAADLPRNTLLVYSKHYGATGWRLGVIALHDDNVIDAMLAEQDQEQKERLNRRYGSLALEPEKMRFIDRMVADSRQVALNHTSVMEARPALRTVSTSLGVARRVPMSSASPPVPSAAFPGAGTWTARCPRSPGSVDRTARVSSSRSVVMERVGAIVPAWRSASEKARSLAISRMTSPSGTAKAMTTIAVTARQTLTRAHLMRAAP
ncbi:Histidinol-phosphate aminotransferase [Streptomyces badius]